MATVKDVARLAGVGSGTVSRYISGNGSVSSKAAEKIERAIKQLNYRPNSMARSLSSRRSDLIGVWVPSLEGPYYHMIIRAVEQELRLHNKHMILANAEDAQSDADRRAHFDYLVNRDCDGILMSCSLQGTFELARTSEHFANLVLLNHQADALAGQCFFIDHELGGRLAARHLVELGHERIAVITGRLSAQDARQRHDGFLDEMGKLGRSIPSDYVVEGAFSYAAAERLVRSFLDINLDFTAVFCGNDKVAMLLISELNNRGRSVPREVSVLGYDDVDFAAYTAPPLSTIHAPIEEMARSACRQLLNLTYDMDLPFQERFEPSLSVRRSTAAPD